MLAERLHGFDSDSLPRRTVRAESRRGIAAPVRSPGGAATHCQGDGVTVAKYVLSGSVGVGAEKNGVNCLPIAVIPS
jgi:hypothetical protein